MKKTFLAFISTMLLVTWVPIAASAADPTNALDQAFLEKEFKIDSSITNPAVDFEFDFTKVSVNEETPTSTNMPAIDPWIWNSNDSGETTVGTDGTIYYQKALTNILPTFTHGGVYVYTVKEKAGSASGVTYDTNSYTLTVYVDDADLANPTVIIMDKDSNKVDPTVSASKHSGFLFTNSYDVKSELKINKDVTGTFGDKTKQFSFTTELTGPAATPITDATVITAKIYKGAVDTGRTAVFTFSANVATANYTLADDEYLFFSNTDASALPVGTTYTVKETLTATEGYVPAATIVYNGGAAVELNGSQNTTLEANLSNTSNKTTVGEGTNSATVTNTYKTVTPTGVLIDLLPFVIMILLAVGGIFLMLRSRRRKDDKNIDSVN